MIRFQRIIDAVLAHLNDPSPVRDLVIDDAQEFSDAIQTANDRLIECSRLIRQGLITEALQRAETKPDLLDLIQILDFHERNLWLGLLNQLQLPHPPTLQLDLAADLNRCFAEQQPKEALLRRHRLLAIGRGPLPARIQVLRQIRDHDPSNPAWHADILALEEVRVQQLAKDAREAIAANDSNAVNQLFLEVKSADWSVNVPSEVLNQLAVAAEKIASEHLLEQLKATCEGLNLAWSGQDISLGQELRVQWHNLEQQIAVPAELHEDVDDALRWLADEDSKEDTLANFQELVSKLTTVLDDQETERHVLESIWSRIQSFHEHQVPEVLGNRLRSRVARIDRSERWRRRFKLTAIAGVVAIVGVGIFLFTQNRAQTDQIANAVTVLTKSFEQGDYPGLLEKLKDYPTFVLKAPAVDDLRRKSEKAISDQEKLVENIGRQLERIAGDNPPETINANDFGDLETELEGVADPLLLVDFENQLEDLRSQWTRYLAEVKRDRERKYDEDLAGLEVSVGSLESNMEATVPQVQSIIEQLEALGRKNKALDSPRLDEIEPLKRRLALKLTDIESYEKVRMSITAITKSVGDARDFRTSLLRYKDAFPASIAGSFELVAAEEELWLGLIAWSSFLVAMPVKDSTAITNVASDVVNRGDELLLKYPMIPLKQSYMIRKEYLGKLMSRASAMNLERSFTSTISGNEFTARLIAGDGGKNFFTLLSVGDLKKAVANPNGSGQVIIGKILSDASQRFETKGISKKTINSITNSPQSVTADSLKALLKGRTQANWEVNYYQMIAKIIEPNQQVLLHWAPDGKGAGVTIPVKIDPLLQAQLLSFVMRIGAEGSLPFSETIKKHKSLLADGNIDPALDWIKPGDDAAFAGRPNAARAVTDAFKMEELSDSFTQCQQMIVAFQDMPECRYQWIGWLGKDRAGNWKLYRDLEKPLAGSLHVMDRKIGTEVSIQLIEIGSIVKDGTVNWTDEAETDDDDPDPAGFEAGRPVFMMPAPVETPTEEE